MEGIVFKLQGENEMLDKFLGINEKLILIDNYLYPKALKVHCNERVDLIPMNSTGILILSLCDGMHTEAEIIDVVSEHYKISKTEIQKDVEGFIEKQICNDNIREFATAQKLCVDKRGREDIILPYQLALELTNDCQLRCKHCYNEAGMKRKGELDSAEIIDIMRQFRELGGTSLLLTGGEVFLKKGIEDILEFAYSNFFRIVIMSNGYTISEKILQILAKSKDKIALQISVDGMKENHDNMRGVDGAFERTMANIKRLISKGISVGIGFTLTDKNEQDLNAIVKYAKELGCSSVNIGAVSKIGRAVYNDISADNISKRYETLLDEVRSLYEDEEFKVGRSAEDIEYEKKEPINKFPNMCGAGYKILHIFADGRIGVCPSSSGVSSKINIGNLKITPLKEVLEVSHMKFILSIPSPSKDICGECIYYDECGRCIVKMLQRSKEECNIVRRLYEQKIIN